MTARDAATQYLTDKYHPIELIQWEVVTPHLHTIFEGKDGIRYTAYLSGVGSLAVYAMTESVENIMKETAHASSRT